VGTAAFGCPAEQSEATTTTKPEPSSPLSRHQPVILSEDWSLRPKRKDQPQSKDLVFLDTCTTVSAVRVPHFSRALCARSGDVTHEHTGQMIAYLRFNGIASPWPDWRARKATWEIAEDSLPNDSLTVEERPFEGRVKRYGIRAGFSPSSMFLERSPGAGWPILSGGWPTFHFPGPPRLRLPHSCVLCKGGNPGLGPRGHYFGIEVRARPPFRTERERMGPQVRDQFSAARDHRCRYWHGLNCGSLWSHPEASRCHRRAERSRA